MDNLHIGRFINWWIELLLYIFAVAANSFIVTFDKFDDFS